MKKDDDVLLIIDLDNGEQVKGIISDEVYKKMIYKHTFNTTKEQRDMARNGESFESIMIKEKMKVLYGKKANFIAYNLSHQMKEIELANMGYGDEDIEEQMTWMVRWGNL